MNGVTRVLACALLSVVLANNGAAIAQDKPAGYPVRPIRIILSVAPGAGAYSFWVESDPATLLDFGVTEPKFEFGETAMNEGLLRELAATTGGQFFREEDLHKLPELISAKTERVQSPMEVELWASPLYFILMLCVVTVEWVVRKLSHLK